MKVKSRNTINAFIAVLFALALLAGCGDDNKVSYSITATNITNNQPFSPMAVVVHRNGYTGWDEGAEASTGLEMLAEGGSTTDFLSEADANPNVFLTDTGSGLILPGADDTVTVIVTHSSDLSLTTASMLVNTNDAFTGANGMLIGDLLANESKTFFTMPIDAGTEANSETAATVPGPAGGGEGYNIARDDRDFVATHSGVVTMDDGLSTSTLDESHRFIGPAAKIVVTRIY